MSIVKMKSVTIAGPIDKFYSILEKYICDKQLHLEDAMSVLSKKEQLLRFEDASNFDPVIKRIEDIAKRSGFELSDKVHGSSKSYTLEKMEELVGGYESIVSDERERVKKLEEKIEHCNSVLEKISYFKGLEVDLAKLLKFEFISYQFGSMPKSSYKTLNTYLSDIDVIFVQISEDGDTVLGFYFTPKKEAGKIDKIFESLYFKAIEIPEDCGGYPSEIKKKFTEILSSTEAELEEAKKATAEKLKDNFGELNAMYIQSQKSKQLNDIRKKAVHSKDFFYLVGWMPSKEVEVLDKQLDSKEDAVMFVATDPDKGFEIQPPTMLKNNPVFKPFEMFVKMYGLPSYKEIDPTPVLALTYILFFGIMFGDVGQSGVFAILGLLLYKIKKNALAGIIGMVGLSGVIFGFIYGSIFGNEEILTPIIAPMNNINTMLIVTIGMGVIIIMVGLCLNIVNAFKSGRYGEAIFGHNGIAGLVFYATVISAILGGVTQLFTIPMPVVITVVIVTILLMFMAEPLGKLVTGQKKWLPDSGMFYVESFFEMFEVILSFFTNTISFLRVGAFAIVHVGMMMVVSVLAESGGVGGMIVMIIGNIVVMALEGLIVGIQVLRLEYYEMFSRYFSGTGREFISVNKK